MKPSVCKLGATYSPRCWAESHSLFYLTLLADLRMGQEPAYVFTFEVARRNVQGLWIEVPSVKLDTPLRVRRGVGWIWARMWDPNVPPVSAPT